MSEGAFANAAWRFSTPSTRTSRQVRIQVWMTPSPTGTASRYSQRRNGVIRRLERVVLRYKVLRSPSSGPGSLIAALPAAGKIESSFFP